MDLWKELAIHDMRVWDDFRVHPEDNSMVLPDTVGCLEEHIVWDSNLQMLQTIFGLFN